MVLKILMNKAVFLDRDGVINAEGDYFSKIDDIKIYPWVLVSLKKIKERGYNTIVVTNQPAIARGLASEEEIKEIHDKMNHKLENLIDKFYFCPHHPEMHEDVPKYARKYRIDCDCRKPKPGMLLKAKEEFDIDFSKSYMVGDKISDIYAGREVGCKTILVKSDENKPKIISSIKIDENLKPDFYAKNLFYVIDIIR